MKKIYVLLVCLFACITTSFAQQGASSLGAQLNFGDETNIGLGIKYRYGLTNHLRIEPAFNYYFENDNVSMWDLGANLHYVFPVANRISIYPLAGLGFAQTKLHFADDSATDGNIAVNLGVGGDFKIASNVVFDLEFKYQIIDNYNQLVLSAGVAFAF